MSEQQRVVYVLTSGLDVGAEIAGSLSAGGARVAWLSDAEPADEPPAGVTRIAASFASRAALEQAFGQARQRVGAASQVVLSALPSVALRPCDVVDLSDADWAAACIAAMKSVLYGLQASHSHMAHAGGSIVVVGPSLSLAGAPQLVALSSAVEGQRGLVKSTARQWGRLGLSVNWVAVAPRALSPLFDGLTLPTKADAVPVAMGRAPGLGAEIVPVIEFLGSAAGAAMTGATLVLDGGEWMLP